MLFFAGTIFTWTSDNTTALLDTIKATLTDFTPLLIPIIAIGMGLIIISVIVGVIRGHN